MQPSTTYARVILSSVLICLLLIVLLHQRDASAPAAGSPHAASSLSRSPTDAAQTAPFFLDCAFTNDGDRPCELPSKAPGTVTVACVGDSITAGNLRPRPEPGDAGGYPKALHRLLAAARPGRYNVINFGESGATMLSEADQPFLARANWPRLLASHPDIILLMLGTNDSKERNWGRLGEEAFTKDALSMIAALRVLPSKPRLFLATPIPLYIGAHRGWDAAVEVVNKILPELIPRIAAIGTPGDAALEIFTCMGGEAMLRPELIADGVHPTREGYAELARCFLQAREW